MQDEIGLIDGILLAGDRIMILGSSAQLEVEDVEHVFVFDRKGGSSAVFEEGLEALRIAPTDVNGIPGMAIMSMFGPVRLFNANGVLSEDIGDEEDGPSDLRPLNDLAQIGSALYAVGMRRQVYRRALLGGNWERIDEGVFVPISEETDSGFLSVSGFSELEVYAVGFEGEIWQYDGSEWIKRDTPTNVRLEAVQCRTSGDVLVCGEAGVILIGRANAWSVVEQSAVETDLIAIAEFGEKTYLASEEEGLFTLDAQGVVEFVDLGALGADGLQRLFVRNDLMLAVFEQQALIFDGNRWERLSLPDVPGL